MAIEIERRWLISPAAVRAQTLAEAVARADIVQGYLSKPEDSLVLRVRQVLTVTLAGKQGAPLPMGPVIEEYIETIKMAQLGLRWPLELEHAVPAQVGRQMLAGAKSRLEKTRHVIPHGAHTIELDVFKGPLEPLIIAEIELTSPTESVLVPDWFGREITHEKAFSNICLAWHGLPLGALQ